MAKIASVSFSQATIKPDFSNKSRATSMQSVATFHFLLDIHRMHTAFRFATVGPVGVQWRLDKRSTLGSTQMFKLYLGICLLSVWVAAWYWWQSAYWVSASVGFGLAALALWMLGYLQHSGDVERIFLQDGDLVVERTNAGKWQREVFSSAHVRVEPVHLDSSLIELSGQGKVMRIGRYVRPELRAALARELRLALKTSV
jgi:uncharacterized membrane protein